MGGKTVFILGAGASCEFGLHDGDKLRQDIAKLLTIKVEHGEITRADDFMLNAIRLKAKANYNGKIQLLVDAARSIAQNMTLQTAHSIDTFINSRQDQPEIAFLGKLAIAKAILDQEHGSHLYDSSDRAPSLPSSADNWLLQLASFISDVPRSQIGKRLSRIAFVVFNYDRCLETFLHEFFKLKYSLGDVDAATLVASIEIYHPYGRVGRLPWELPGTALWQMNAPQIVAPFGTPLSNGQELIKIGESLRTYTEEAGLNADELERIRELVADAKEAIYLGFAFYEQNLRILYDKRPPANTTVYGTVFGESNPHIEAAKARLSSFGRITQTDFEDAKCYPYLRSRVRNLAF